MLEPVFKCVVDHPQDGVLYDVQWFIGNDLIPKAGSYNVTYQTMNTSSLKTDHWADNYSLNFNSESSEIVVKESEQVEIRLTNSVPLSCPTSLNDSMKQGSCKLPVNIWTTAEKYRERCRNGLLMEDLLIDSLQCAVTFEFNEFGNSSIVFNVTGYTDGMINYQNRTSRIHFNVSNYYHDRHGIWRNISIPEIKATVVDRDYLVDWRLCTSYNDPHMTTFDGKTWENHRPGEFVMYRHQHLPYSVNVLFSSCVAGYATCNCGVAVRSNLSLYVVRTCAQVSSTQTELLTFPYENLTLNRTTDLHVSKLGRLYEATFPTGTKVSFDLSYDDTWISSVRVRASVSDIDATEGLCGLINGDQSDDFIPKQENNSTDEQTFLLSWRVPLKSNESLFSKQPKLSPNLNRREYEMYSLCTSIPNDTSSEVVLNTSVPSMLCTEDNSITTNLSLLSDKTTEAGFTEDLSYDPNYSETDTPQLSGNTTYLQDTMNTFKGACFQEVTHGEVYYVNRTTDGRFLADIIFSVLCPRDCSGNGNCTNGNCNCFSGFIGSDCSIQLSSPLEGFRLPFDGLCDSSAPRSCQTFFIFTNNSVINTSESFTHATYHHYNLIALDISLDSQGNNTGAAIGCYVTLSYDGTTYGDPQILLIYDKDMYDCNRETLECTSKASPVLCQKIDDNKPSSATTFHHTSQ
uniref:von Willebrand factor D and EGF domain-containing protein n=1 Tax=Magallana gigas TaxID=29159 RepID=K1RGG5_MAGGI